MCTLSSAADSQRAPAAMGPNALNKLVQDQKQAVTSPDILYRDSSPCQLPP